MHILGKINNRLITYLQYHQAASWYTHLPENPWLLLVITGPEEKSVFSEINRRIIEHDAAYVCAMGPCGELFHDMLDEDIALRDAENQYLPAHILMTTWHHHPDEGFWFALFAAQGAGNEIRTVVCLDLSRQDHAPQLTSLLQKFVSGWLPPDEAD